MRATTTSPGPPQLETLVQAEAQNLRRIDALVDRVPEIAAALEACDRNAWCCLVICAVCSRRLPVPIDSQVARHREVISRPARRLRRSFWKRFLPERWPPRTSSARTIGSGSVSSGTVSTRSLLIGGTEVNWDSADRSWILHVHLLAIGVPPAAWKRLRKALRGVGTKFPVKVQLLRNPERQISYLNEVPHLLSTKIARRRGPITGSPAAPGSPGGVGAVVVRIHLRRFHSSCFGAQTAGRSNCPRAAGPQLL